MERSQGTLPVTRKNVEMSHKLHIGAKSFLKRSFLSLTDLILLPLSRGRGGAELASEMRGPFPALSAPCDQSSDSRLLPGGGILPSVLFILQKAPGPGGKSRLGGALGRGAGGPLLGLPGPCWHSSGAPCASASARPSLSCPGRALPPCVQFPVPTAVCS